MYPSLEKVREIAASGEYRRIPVCMEMLSDSYTPVEVLRTLRKMCIRDRGGTVRYGIHR